MILIGQRRRYELDDQDGRTEVEKFQNFTVEPTTFTTRSQYQCPNRRRRRSFLTRWLCGIL